MARNTALRSSQIEEEAITESKLDIVNSPTNNYVLSWNSSEEKFEWVSAGVGDMLKSTYDTDDDGIVDKAETLTDGGTGNEVTYAQAQDAVDKAHTEVATLGITIDGGGEVITSGNKGYIRIPYTCTITAWTLLGNVSGNIKIDVWKDSFTNYPPTNTDSICNGHEPELSSATKAEDNDLSDWGSVSVTAGDVISFYVDSCSVIERAVLQLEVTKV